MRTSVGSGIVTTDDLVNFFKGKTARGDEWESSVQDGVFRASCSKYSIELSPHGAMYNVRISDKDNPSDSDEQITDDPAEFIVNYMGTGTSGDEFFENRLSTLHLVGNPLHGPSVLQSFLNRLAASIDGGNSLSTIASILRRTVVMLDPASVYSIIDKSISIARGREDFEVKELAALKVELADKGWQVKIQQNEHDLPTLLVNIGDMFEAVISVDHQSWDYKFELNGKNLIEDGVTDDPIVAFKDFRVKSKGKSDDGDSAIDPSGPTIRARPKR